MTKEFFYFFKAWVCLYFKCFRSGCFGTFENSVPSIFKCSRCGHEWNIETLEEKINDFRN